MAGHIKIELDFIPVEERLPPIRKLLGDDGVVGLLYFSGEDYYTIEARGNLGYHGAAKGWLYDWDDSIPQQWGDGVELTHWAELPTIKKEE